MSDRDLAPPSRRLIHFHRPDPFTVQVYGSIIVSVLLLIGYFACFVILLAKGVDLANGKDQILILMFTTLQTMVVAVPTYWLRHWAEAKSKTGENP